MYLPLSKSGETTDIDLAQRILSQELTSSQVQRVDQPGRFSLSMHGVRFRQVMVGFNCFDTTTVIDAGSVDDAVIVVIGDGHLPSIIHLDGEAVVTTPSTAAILSPSRHVLNERPANAGAYGIRVPIDAIQTRLRELTGHYVARPIAYDRGVDLSQGPGAQLGRMFRFALSELQYVDPGSANRSMYAAFGDMLLSAMLWLPNTYTKVLEQAQHPTLGLPLVRRAEAYLEAHATEPITMSDLATVCGQSRVTLFKSFRKYRDYTPMQFLAECRLQKARKQLQASDSGESVTSIAYACGFSHLGRFSQAYRKRFGENPLDTLRQARKT